MICNETADVHMLYLGVTGGYLYERKRVGSFYHECKIIGRSLTVLWMPHLYREAF